jgi:predicted phage terminase large subunit-like protein
MAKTRDYADVIKAVYKEIERLFKTPKLWDKEDEKIIQLFSILKEAVFEQVHNVLAPQRTASAEKELRDIIAKYVIGYTEKKKGVNFIGSISPIRAKLVQLKKTKAARSEYIARYLDLYDDFMALAAFRSMKHYFLYMQQVFAFTVWEDTQNCFDGYWYYAGRMVLDGEVKFIEKQCPTGFGKSLSDAFMQSWILGIDIDNDILKVCGNDKFTDDCFQNVLKLMLSPQYSKVFPYYAQFKCESEFMFQFCSRKDLKFAINGSKKSTNFRIVTKLSDVNGVRAKYLFLDDITQRKDMANLNQHQKDIHSFTHEWFERNYNRNFFYIIASGTTYSQFDLLSHLRRVMGGDEAVKSPINKYTLVGKSNYIVPNGVSVFVSVPLLDYDTDESTYPKKISTESARKKREESPTEFWAMDQQRPLPPDSSPFYFTKLRQYTTLPKIGEAGRLENCVAALDTKRRGKDFLSMPIFFEANDPEREGQTVFYLVDWLYDDRPMKECLPLVVAKVIQHKITRLFVERNTEECIETLIQDKLREQGYTSCVIEEVYSTEPKDRRIMAAEGDIKARLIFPQYGMYSQSNDIGKALMNFYGYTYTGTVAHDDAPDSLALFAKRFVMNATRRYGKVTTFRR